MTEDIHMRRPVTYAIQPDYVGNKLDINGCTWASNLEQAKAIAKAGLISDGPQVIWVVHISGEPYKLMRLNDAVDEVAEDTDTVTEDEAA